MTNSIQTALVQALPSKRKQTPSGWLSVNAVCCHHTGETQDKECVVASNPQQKAVSNGIVSTVDSKQTTHLVEQLTKICVN